MKKTLLIVAVFLACIVALAVSPKLHGGPTLASARQSPENASMSGRDRDTQKLPTTGWPLVGGDLDSQYYSALTQINLQTVKGLGGAWVSKAFDGGTTSVATPVMEDGRLFLTAGTQIYAIDAKTGAVLWTYQTAAQPWNPNLLERATSGSATPATQGVSLGEGLVYAPLYNGTLIALRQSDGSLVWQHDVGDEASFKREGHQTSAPPIYWKHMLYLGVSADYGSRGQISALDAETGRELWHFSTVPGPGQAGDETWPKNSNVWKWGGGGVWQPGTLDPDLGLVFYGTGNAVPQSVGELRPGNNLYTVSVIALDMQTGKLRWYYQLIHHDIWEGDIATATVLYDAQVNGQTRKAIGAMRANGDLFLLDRATGKPIIPVEERPVPQDAIQHTSPTQPFVIGGESILPPSSYWKDEIPAGFVLGSTFSPASLDVPNLLAPGFSVRVTPMSYSPQTGYFYARGIAGLGWRRRAPDPYYSGVGGRVPGLESVGVLAAIDSRTDKIAWEKKMPVAVLGNAGSLTTAGGLLFRHGGDGTFTAYDAKSGDVLWQFSTGFAGPSGPPVTYEIDGEQYVAVSAGPNVWAFKLGGTVQPLPQPKMPSPSADPFVGPIEDQWQIETASLQRDIDSTGQRYFVNEYAFNPYRIRVKVGTRVVWVNNGTLVHTIIAKDGSWTTGAIEPGGYGFTTFDKPGNYVYISKEYPWSYGEIIVVNGNATSNGIYTGEQATRGMSEFLQSCSSGCHGADLAGQGAALALAGDPFMERWRQRTVGDLFDFVRSSMPQNDPGSLSPTTYLDIVAYLLKSNNFPPGQQELKANSPALKQSLSQK